MDFVIFIMMTKFTFRMLLNTQTTHLLELVHDQLVFIIFLDLDVKTKNIVLYV